MTLQHWWSSLGLYTAHEPKEAVSVFCFKPLSLEIQEIYVKRCLPPWTIIFVIYSFAPGCTETEDLLWSKSSLCLMALSVINPIVDYLNHLAPPVLAFFESPLLRVVSRRAFFQCSQFYYLQMSFISSFRLLLWSKCQPSAVLPLSRPLSSDLCFSFPPKTIFHAYF